MDQHPQHSPLPSTHHPTPEHTHTHTHTPATLSQRVALCNLAHPFPRLSLSSLLSRQSQTPSGYSSQCLNDVILGTHSLNCKQISTVRKVSCPQLSHFSSGGDSLLLKFGLISSNLQVSDCGGSLTPFPPAASHHCSFHGLSLWSST